MAEGLRLKVDADLSSAEKALDKFVQTAQRDGKAAANALQRPLAGITPSVNNAVTSLNKLPAATNKAKFSMIELSRVVQDLPFGFAGISNNLTQLIPGVGLAGLAFSALVSAVTFSQIGLQAWTRGSGGAKKGADDLSESTRKAKEEQEKFTEAMNSAAAAVLNEAGNIEDLKRTLVDTSNEYNTLTEAVIKQGLAQALFSSKEEIIQKKLARIIGDRINQFKEMGEVREFDANELKKVSPFQFEKRTGPILGTLDDDRITKRFKERISLEKQEGKELAFLNGIAEHLGITFDQFIKTDKLKKEVEFVPVFKTRFDLKDLLKTTDAAAISLDIEGIKFRELPQTDIEKLKEKLESSVKGLTPSVNLQIKLQKDQLEATAKQVRDFANGINAEFKRIQVDLLANVGEAIGTALAGGDLQNVFRNFGNIIAGGLQAIGKQLIVVSKLAELTQKALAQLFTNPGLALAVGVGLIAAGAALKTSLSKGVKGFAQGGLVFGPTFGMVGEGSGTSKSNPEVIAPLDKLRGMIGDMMGGQPQLVFGRIRGNDILLSNNRTNRSNRR